MTQPTFSGLELYQVTFLSCCGPRPELDNSTDAVNQDYIGSTSEDSHGLVDIFTTYHISSWRLPRNGSCRRLSKQNLFIYQRLRLLVVTVVFCQAIDSLLGLRSDTSPKKGEKR